MSALVDYTIDFNVDVPEEVMYRSTHYRNLRLALNKLLDRPTGEWMQVRFDSKNGEALDGIVDKFRAAIYTWSTAIELKKANRKVKTLKEKNDDGNPVAVYVCLLGLDEN